MTRSLDALALVRSVSTPSSLPARHQPVVTRVYTLDVARSLPASVRAAVSGLVADGRRVKVRFRASRPPLVLDEPARLVHRRRLEQALRDRLAELAEVAAPRSRLVVVEAPAGWGLLGRYVAVPLDRLIAEGRALPGGAVPEIRAEVGA